MNIVGRQDRMLLAGLAIALIVVFARPIRYLLDLARKGEQSSGFSWCRSSSFSRPSSSFTCKTSGSKPGRMPRRLKRAAKAQGRICVRISVETAMA